MWRFPDFFHRTPFLASGCASLVVLIVSGVGPAILTQAVTLGAALFLTATPPGAPMLGAPGDVARLAVFVGFYVLSDWLAWQRERSRLAASAGERALRESDTRYRHILEQASDGIVLADPKDGRLLLVNSRICEMMGYSEAELLQRTVADLYAPGELTRNPLAWDALARDGVVIRERLMVRKDGSTVPVEVSVRLSADGLAQAIVRDITERRNGEQAIRRERDLLDGILATSVAGIIVVTPEGRVVFLNPRAEAVLGVTRELLADRTEMPPGWRWLTLDGEEIPEADRPSRRVITTGIPVEDFRCVLERPDGQCRVLAINAAPLREAEGSISAIVLSLSDITDQQLAQRTLHEREEQLQRITGAMPGVVYQFVVAAGGAEHFAFVSERAPQLLGVSVDQIERDPDLAWSNMEPEDRKAMSDAFERASRSLDAWNFEFRVRGPNGTIRWLRDMAVPHPAVDPDRVIWNGVIVDITDRKRLAEELLQSQKMESLGRLAGGVAHDFNNLLTVIRGYADVLAGEFGEGDPRLEEVQEIRGAADRASSLTRQLLAMSRRQVLSLREIDLNALVQDMERMLRRVIGERVSIVTVPGPALGLVRADPGQLEQVLLNLAVNARDAMPDGGVLTIETAAMELPSGRDEAGTRGVPPGDYVVLRVGDSGIGMDPDTQVQIFEPFFTTKPVGEGTGLGLSTVYGIVQQSQGFVTVESTEGAGTDFRVFLPRLPARAGTQPRIPVEPPRQGPTPFRGRVLVVEDDDRVRQLTRRVLEQYGFGTIEARNGAEALAILESNSVAIDAVVSDVVMPEMSGRDLLTRLRLTRPSLPVLFLSGYTGDEVAESLRDHAYQQYLQKPFSPDALAAALEELLGSGARQ